MLPENSSTRQKWPGIATALLGTASVLLVGILSVVKL